jgi:hypothetical protein
VFWARPLTPFSRQSQRDFLGAPRHVLVRPHPVTGAPALYWPCATSRGVEGMADGEGKELLRELTGPPRNDPLCVFVSELRALRYRGPRAKFFPEMFLRRPCWVADHTLGPQFRREHQHEEGDFVIPQGWPAGPGFACGSHA